MKRTRGFHRLIVWCRRHPIWTAIIVLIFIVAGCASNATSKPPQTTANTTPITITQDTFTQVSNIPTNTPTTQPSPSPTVTATPKPVVTQKVQPTSPPPKPTPTKSTCQAINNNPWCYNFSPGTLIYYPPNGFCTYFNCITSFYGSDDPGDGYIVECTDTTYSQSGGERGACSGHGGVLRPLYHH